MKKFKLTALFVVTTLLFSMLGKVEVNAMNCPVCEQCGLHTGCVEHGLHQDHKEWVHTKSYVVLGRLKTDTCYVGEDYDRIYWDCPLGHGNVYTCIRVTQNHSCSKCEDLVYFQ